MSISLLLITFFACSPDTDADCVVYGESCGCSYYCGTEWDKNREQGRDTCLIGCPALAPAITDEDCIVVENECQWTEEVKETYPESTLEH